MPENKPKLTDPKLDELCEKAARLGYRTALSDIHKKLLDLYPQVSSKERTSWFIVFDVLESLHDIKKQLT